MDIDAPYLSAFAGLAGVAVGGLTSFATTYWTQQSLTREKRRQAEAGKREKLFNEFIGEASRLFGDAIGQDKDDITDLVRLYSLIGRMRLICTEPVIVAAEQTMQAILDAYLAPKQSLHDLRELARAGGMNPLIMFDTAGREELGELSGRWR
jgi:hypothetical protein